MATKIRVLAADDSAVMREVLRMVFAMHANAGSRMLPAMELVAVVKDGVEALEAVRTMHPDVLLLDLGDASAERAWGAGTAARTGAEAAGDFVQRAYRAGRASDP